ncbi:Uncharacterised protein [Agrobacterium tumefaciens]|nr:Uncharacterised protein [Agrobacterium tumefaciens]
MLRNRGDFADVDAIVSGDNECNVLSNVLGLQQLRPVIDVVVGPLLGINGAGQTAVAFTPNSIPSWSVV